MTETFLQRMTTSKTWNDLSVGEETLSELKAIAAQVQSGRGGIALFTGSSGTGKTMAAGILAQEFERELYRVDLGLIVSKYIGETEKNLSGLLERSQTLDVVLLFDEADALFGKRSEVKDAHDRYANFDVDFLLKKIEDYSGLVILVSNLHSAFDDAFIRRMTWATVFTKPQPKPRLSWWTKLLRWLRLK